MHSCITLLNNSAIIKKHQHSEDNEDIESYSYMYDTCNNPTTTYLEVNDSIKSSMSGRFSNSNSSSKLKHRFYNTRYLRFGWTRRPPRESQQHKHKYFRRKKGHSLIGTDDHPQSADNQCAKIVRNRPKGFKRTSPDAHNPLTVPSPVKKTADKISKKTAAKAKSLPRYFPLKGAQRVVTFKTSSTMKVFRTSENIIDTQLLLSSQDQTTSGDSDQVNCSGDQGISDSRNDQSFSDTRF